MTTPKTLPLRPSLESLRKQAKRLSREIAAGNAQAIARARAQLPQCELPLTLRNAQLVLAREYGFAGWRELERVVLERADHTLTWALREAERIIHDNDLDRLRPLIADHPGLLSYQDDGGGSLLGHSMGSFSDCFAPEREETYTRPAIAEYLLDAGAALYPPVWENIMLHRSRGLLHLLWSRGLLPRTLPILAAVGDVGAIRAHVDGQHEDLPTLQQAFVTASRFCHEPAAAFLLERCLEQDEELRSRIDGGPGRAAFIAYLGEHPQEYGDPWLMFVMHQLLDAIAADDLPAFTRGLQSEPLLLGVPCIPNQIALLERAAWQNRGPFIVRLLELDPALVHRRPPPPASALEYAMEYGNADLVPLLTRIWPLPDDLPHAAALGDFDRVKRWFDDAGRPALGRLDEHYPVNNGRKRAHLNWGEGTVQQVLDVALAWACMNRQLEIAAFLLERGSNVNTDWSTHEPASILHECVLYDNAEAVEFLIEHGIDLSMRDFRWNATAEGWAYAAANDAALARRLAEAQRQREQE